MENIIIKSHDIKVSKSIFHQHKRPIPTRNVDTNTIVVSDKTSFGKKKIRYFVGYAADKIQNFMCISTKMSPYRNEFDETNTYFFK